MSWIVHKDFLVAEDSGDHISRDTLELLTGKRITFDKRDMAKLEIKRFGGHIHLYDEKFIEGEHYKFGNVVYICKCCHPDGMALLVPEGTSMELIATDNTDDWEIV